MTDTLRQQIAQVQEQRIDSPDRYGELQEQLGWLVLQVVWRGYE